MYLLLIELTTGAKGLQHVGSRGMAPTLAGPRFAIITGANRPSIGFRAAELLAAAPHRFRVILACRDAGRGLQAQSDIRAAHPDAWVQYLPLDLASLSSVRAFVDTFRRIEDGEPRRVGLSLLVCNAGVGFGRDTTRRVTADGFEERLGVNHLGHFLLTNLLLPDLQRSREARVVVVSSSLHNGAGHGSNARPVTMDLEDPQLAAPGAYEVGIAYRRSKLANLLFAYELKRRLTASGCSTVHVSALSPGFIPATGLVREAGPLGIFFLRHILDGLLKWIGLVSFTRTVDDGAHCIVLCATSGAAVDGGYHQLERDGVTLTAVESSTESCDEAKAKALWTLSAKLTAAQGSVADLTSLSPPRGGQGERSQQELL